MIDTHCHIDMYRSPGAAAQEVERLRIMTVGVTNLPSHYQLGMSHTSGFRYLYLALGLHPLYARYHAAELGLFDVLADQADYIGEVGLDFSWEGRETRDLQIASFERVLAKIASRKRFVTLHSRGAEREVLEALRRHRMYSVVFHWYSGNQKTLDEIIGDEHYFSVNTAMLQAERGRRLVARIPYEKLLTESDGPHVRVNDKAANPKHIRLVLEAVANLWGMREEEVEARIAHNFTQLFIP